uniref:mannosyl-oligosaccharide glucosidase n=1 Tax=Romanomermis culicivorax TaxID=13658 RepID=A0A915KYX9_ROMCU
MLNDENHLNMFHWSQKRGRYCDYGFHTKNTKLERAPLEPLADGSPNPASPHMRRVVSVEPKLRLVSDTFGYVSLFPLFLRLIPYNSPKLGTVLGSLKDEDLLWTPYGLRSLAITSPLYGVRNTEHDPPYWRGAIWINMNYLALSSLHYYSRLDGPHRQTAFEIYASLRNNLITNIVKEYKHVENQSTVLFSLFAGSLIQW